MTLTALAVSGCFGLTLPRNFSGFSSFRIVTNEGPLGMGLFEGYVYEATIQKESDGRYRLEAWVVVRDNWGVSNCSVDVYSELPTDIYRSGGSGSCPELMEAEPRYLTAEEATEVQDLFRSVLVGQPPLIACVPPWEPGPINFVRWDNATFHNFCCFQMERPCILWDDAWRIQEFMNELAAAE